MKCYKVFFIVCPKGCLPKYINIRFWLFAFILYKALLKSKKRSRNSLPAPFFAWFLKKNISHVIYSINWTNVISWLPLLLEILSNMCIVIICCPVCDVINFGITFHLRTKPLFYITTKSRQKCKYLKNEKSF